MTKGRLKNSVFYLFLFILFLSCASFGSLPAQDRVCLKGRCFKVEFAQTEEDRRRGLQFRQSLDNDSGMLFVFPVSETHLFWMKNTLIPLDMIWIDKERKVVAVESRALPCSNDPCPTYGKEVNSLYVLEVSAGLVEKLKIRPGDRAVFRLR